MTDPLDDEEIGAGTALMRLKRAKSQKTGIAGGTDSWVFFLIHFLLAAIVTAPLPSRHLVPEVILTARHQDCAAALTVGLSTALRSGRDDKPASAKDADFVETTHWW